MEKLTKEQANLLISAKLEEAKKLIADCEVLADQYGLVFQTPILEYGMGGYYQGKDPNWQSSACEWETSDEGGRW